MSWRPTRAQIEAAGAGPFVAGRPWTYRQIFVDKTARIPFEDEEYDAENEGLDPRRTLARRTRTTAARTDRASP
jgi:hypothetical protein